MARTFAETVERLGEFEKPPEPSISEKRAKAIAEKRAPLAGRLPNPFELIFEPTKAMERYRLVNEAYMAAETDYDESLPKMDTNIGKQILDQSLEGGIPQTTRQELPSYLQKDSVLPEAAAKPLSYEDFIKEYQKSFTAGMPKYNEGYGKEFARLSAKEAGTAARKESEAAALSKDELERQSNFIQSELDLQNAKFNEYIQNNQRFQQNIDSIQAKYPLMTRADIVQNMSTTEKITTALLTVLGAAGGAKPDENPDLRVFNQTLDQSVQKQALLYEREIGNLRLKKDVDNDTFKAEMARIDNDLRMKLQASNNQLKMIDLGRSMRTKGEVQDIEDKTRAGLLAYNEQVSYNARMGEFKIGLEAKKFATELALARGENLLMYNQPIGVGQNGEVVYKQVPMFIRKNLKVEDVSQPLNLKSQEYGVLAKIRYGYESGASASYVDSLVTLANKEFYGGQKVIPYYRKLVPGVSSTEKADPFIVGRMKELEREIPNLMTNSSVPYSQNSMP